MTGVDNWIGGSTSNNRPGINFQMGWDRAKNTGGIVFNTTVPNIAAPPSKPTILNDILVENSSVENTSWGGIVLKQYSGTSPGAKATGWGLRTSATDSKYSPFTNVTIQGNYIIQSGTAYGANGMLIDDVRNGLVQNNLVDRVGTSGIEFDYSDQVIAQHNEVTGTTVKAGGGDSNGIDTDMGVTNAVVQYNYLHDNGMGYLSCACNSAPGSTPRPSATTCWPTTRTPRSCSTASAAASTTSTTTPSTTPPPRRWSTAAARPRSPTTSSTPPTPTPRCPPAPARPTTTTSTAATVPPSPRVRATPSPATPSSPTRPAGGTGTQATGPDLKAGLNWKISANSPAVRAGIAIASNGGLDYNGAPIPSVPDLGALQHS